MAMTLRRYAISLFLVKPASWERLFSRPSIRILMLFLIKSPKKVFASFFGKTNNKEFHQNPRISLPDFFFRAFILKESGIRGVSIFGLALYSGSLIRGGSCTRFHFLTTRDRNYLIAFFPEFIALMGLRIVLGFVCNLLVHHFIH